ncbi:hypothetical protein PFISCL1PPCAC_7620 [Pristionchus fissidentatus]|uniref:NOT2/NOT3/NOT5 C-terminal domain-containing protein n=1 Tax=Pristionchus fissidentatus TaxID=1538716 RepID=A0AAV5VAR8_9BILA|nr:hypothetical protein PFISCL1PPCAC_7620 [Pristionchus fissidentatus]
MRGVDVGMTNNAEFHIQNEDFPALPGTEGLHDVPILNSGVVGGGGILPAGVEGVGGVMSGEMVDRPTELGASATSAALAGGGGSSSEQPPGIITHISGLCSNIPPSMLADQFGMAGLLTYLRQAENPSIVSLALGTDLTTLGLNLNLNERHLYTTFGGPWADAPCRTQDLDAKEQDPNALHIARAPDAGRERIHIVPDEYLTNSTIRDKLPNIKLNKLSEDVLFFLFYNCPGEVYQMAAASELYGRDWRFHKQEGVWLTRSQYGGVKEQTSTFERGSYMVFDPLQWRKIPKDMRLEYRELEERPKLPAAVTNATAGALGGATPIAVAGSTPVALSQMSGSAAAAPNTNGTGAVPPPPSIPA